MEIEVTKMTINQDETTGTTEYNDGSRMHWSEGRGTTHTHIDANGNRTEIYSEDDNDYTTADNKWRVNNAPTQATQEDEIRYKNER